MSWSLENPQALYLFALLLVLFVLKWVLQIGLKPGLPVSMDWISRGWNLLFLLRIPLYLGLSCWIVALARPQIHSQTLIPGQGVPQLALVMDVSASMGLLDLLEPQKLNALRRLNPQKFVQSGGLDAQGRLASAKMALQQILQGLDSAQASLVFFEGEPRLISPATRDLKWLSALVQTAHAGEIGVAGTLMGPALQLGAQSLGSEPNGSSLLLVTDGADPKGWNSLLPLVEWCKSKNIRIHSLAVGRAQPTESWYPFDSDSGWHWEKHLIQGPELADETLLRRLSQSTGGEFCRAGSSHELAQCVSGLSQSAKSKAENRVVQQSRSLSSFFFLWGLLALLCYPLLRLRWSSPWI